MRHIVILIIAVLLTAQCACSSAGEFEAGPSAKRYRLKGKVVSVDRANKTAAIAHGAIADLMPAMTMDFRIREEWVWDVLKPGAGIQADLVVDNVNGHSWLENPRITSSTAVPGPRTVRNDRVSIGKKVIDFKLTDQDRKPVTPADFRGKAWAVTFIYTNCPLPDYCILMSRNFSDLANRIAGDKALRDSIRLLSISFDPARDTPTRLKQYGLGYLGKNSPASDFRVWRLAVGKEGEIRKIANFFGLRYETDAKDETQIIHSLRTIVIGPDGTVRDVLPGNDWKTADLLSALKDSLKAR